MARPSVSKTAPAPDDRPLHLKWRPTTFDAVIGQDAAVKSLRGVLKKNVPHTFLFSGPSGCGKTTLARILASELNISSKTILEVDAARFSSVAEMRSLVDRVQFRPVGVPVDAQAAWFVIVDECHAMSKGAWQSLLKDSEEPADFVYWAFATTELDKVPNTIVTRCHHSVLKSVPRQMLSEYLDYVNEEESLKVAGDVLDLVAAKSNGSVRQALQYLAAVRGCEDRKEAFDLMASAEEHKGAVDFARWLVQGQGMSWKEGMRLLGALEEEGVAPEGVRLVVVNYVANTLKGKKEDKGVPRLLAILDAFSGRVFNQSEKMAPVVLALGKVMYGED